MPRVPVYDGFQVQDRALPGYRQQSPASASLLDGGASQLAQFGDALQRTGAGARDILLKEQERQDADLLMRAETAIKTEYLEFENAARARKGQQAWGIANDAKVWFDKKIQEHEGGLQTEPQKRVFRQQAEKLRLQSLGQFHAYEADERRKSLEQSAQASIVGSVNTAAAAASQAPRGTQGEGGFAQSFDVSAHKLDVIKRVQMLAEINGWGPELRAAKEQEFLTNFHKQIIQARVDKDPAGAKVYFEANRGEIAGSDHDAIDKVLKIGGLKETAQTFADEVTKSGMGEAEALAAAREKFSGDEEAAAVTEIKTRFAEVSQARERTQRTAADQAWKIFSTAQRFSAIPASVLAQMDGKDIESLRTHARVVAEGRAVKTDPSLYLDLREMARNDPQGFQKLDLRRYIGKLSTGDLQEFSKLQGNVEKLKDVATLGAQLSNMHDQLGWGSDDKEKKGTFDRVVTDAINREQERAGKVLSYEERQKIIDRMAIEGEVLSGSWYLNDPNKRFYEVSGTEEAKRFAPTIPSAEREKIAEALKRAGRRVTDAEVTRLYKQKHGLQ